jgi:hypothetical protein
MTDKRRWMTAYQHTFLDGYVVKYLDAQANHTYHKFWPPLFQVWFAKFSKPDPKEDDPTDTEIKDDSEPDAACESGTEGAVCSAGSKHKKSEHKARFRKLAKKVFLLFYNSCPLC